MSEVVEVCCDQCDKRGDASKAYTLIRRLPIGWQEFANRHFCGWQCLRDYVDERLAAESAAAAESA